MVIFKILISLFFCFCYALGGQGYKWARKLVGPVCFGSFALAAAHFHNWMTVLGALGYLAAANGFAYGDDWTYGKTSLKVLFRGLCGASYGLCGFMIGFGSHLAWLGVTQLILATAGAILFGVLNPFSRFGDKGVILEDLCISLSFVCIVPFLV